MPLPESWVERIFARLSVRYGTDWTSKWTGVDPAAIKADWANELGGFSADALSYALGFLPIDRPPTASQFRAICNRAPAAPFVEPKIALDAPKADPERLKRVFEHMHAIAKARSPTSWIADVEARRDGGENLSSFQIQALENARENLGWNRKSMPGSLPADVIRTEELKRASAAQVAAYAERTGHAL